jgi:hypothetical protein
MLKSIVLFIAPVRLGTIFSVVREISRIKKVYKSIILESNQECVTLTNISFALSYQCYTHLFQI